MIKNINQLIDHTLLRADATPEEIRRLCDEAAQYRFKTVCINPSNIEDAKRHLAGSGVLVCTVIGFPLGAMTTAAKVFEAKDAIASGADEVDMVINIGRMKAGEHDFVREEIRAIKQACGSKVLKVIIETALLSDTEIVAASRLTLEGGADFVKTSTGFSKAGATPAHVKLMHDAVSGKIQIKAAGGVKTPADLEAMVTAGASRIGTSQGVALMGGQKAGSGY